MKKINFVSGKNVRRDVIVSENNKIPVPLNLYLRKIEDYLIDEAESDGENIPEDIEYDIIKRCATYEGKPIDDGSIFSFVERFNVKFPHMKVNEKIFKAYLKSGCI